MTLNELMQIVAPSGYEEPLLQFCETHAKRRGFFTKRDRVGNLLISNTASPRDKSIALYAHADQIGFVINYIDDGGFLYFKPIGGWDPAVFLGQRVVIVNDKNKHIPGVINRAATHLLTLEEQSDEIKVEDLWIDIGADDKDRAEWLVSVGNVGCIKPQLIEDLYGPTMTGPCFDDRIGVAIIMNVLENIKNVDNLRVSVIINKAEEIGNFEAAAVAAAEFQSQIAIAVDVTPATDQPGISKEKHGDIKLGLGPSIGTGGLTDRTVSFALKRVAKDFDIPCQTEVITGSSGTDMDGVFRSGTPCGVIYIPCRYLHTPTEVVNKNDVDNAVLILTEYCKQL